MQKNIYVFNLNISSNEIANFYDIFSLAVLRYN